jgi:hypothetical protein
VNAFPMIARCAARQHNPSIHGPSEWTPEACACGDPKWHYYKVCALCAIRTYEEAA